MLDEETISEITRDVFAVFGYDAYPIGAAAAANGISSSVAIDGPESAIVEVQMPYDIANHLASVMLDENGAQDEKADFVQDLAGEIANMIGGNVKGLLSGPSSLSIPSVDPSSDYASSIPASADMQKTVAFECALGRFFVTVTLTSKPETDTSTRRRPTGGTNEKGPGSGRQQGDENDRRANAAASWIR